MTGSVRKDYFLLAYRRARGENQNKHSNVEDDYDDDDDNHHDNYNDDRNDNEWFCATSSPAREVCVCANIVNIYFLIIKTLAIVS